jgi:Cdc6-like AAA superfamily ATPase
MITNYHDIFINVEPRIRSSLDIEEIEFKRYTLQEMKDILTERCRDAFRPGILEEGVILLCANHAVQRGGDVRLGLECLRKSARICENENENKITVKYVKEVLKDVKQVKLKMMKDKLKGIENDIVSLLTEDEVMSTEFHKKYVENFGEISQFALSRHIKHLQEIGIVKIRESRKETRGRKYFISLMKRKVFK